MTHLCCKKFAPDLGLNCLIASLGAMRNIVKNTLSFIKKETWRLEYYVAGLVNSKGEMFWFWLSVVTVTLCIFSCELGMGQQVQFENGTGVGKVPLYLGAFYSQGERWDGSGVIVAMDLAFEVVNNRTDILSGYELKPIWNDTKCDSGQAARSFFHLIHTPPQKIAMVGPPCSKSAPAIEASQYWNLVTMGYSAEGEALSNKRKFPLFFRTNPVVNGKEQIPLVELVKRYGWKQVALVVESHSVISSIARFTQQILSEIGVNVYSEYFSRGHSIQSQVENIKERRIKVMFMITIELTAQCVFCEFFHQEWYGEGFAWFIPHYFKNYWWEFPNENIDCSQNEMRTVVDGAYYFISRPLAVPQTNSEIISHFTMDKFNEEILQRLSWPKFASLNISLSGYEQYAFDAVWALALMLNKSAEVLETKDLSDGRKHCLEEFTYEESEMTELFVSTLLEDVKFLGFSGDVYFTEDENDDRFKSFEVLQMQGVCEPGWLVNFTSCFVVIAGESAWQDAQKACQNISADLAAIHSWKELEFVSSLLKHPENVSTNQFWLGAADYMKGLDKTDDIMHHSGCFYYDLALNVVSKGDCQTTRPFICKKRADFALQSLGWYDDSHGNLTLYNDIIWPGGVVPADFVPDVKQSTQFTYTEAKLPSILHIIISCAAGVGIVIALLFLFVTTYFANHESNCKLNNVILFAAILTFLSVPLTINSEIFPKIGSGCLLKICYAQLWLESLAFVAVVGAIVTQLWRVYRTSVFTNIDKNVGDLRLLTIVLMLVAIDAGFLVAHFFFSPFEIANVTVSTTKVDPTDTGGIIKKFTTTCVSSGHFFHVIILFTDKIFLVLACLFLSYETRLVEKSFSSDTKWLVISFYNITIFSTIRFALKILLRSNPISQYVFLSALSIICSTSTVCVIFIPKVLHIYGVTVSTNSSEEGSPQIGPISPDINQSDVCLNETQTVSSDIRRRDWYILRVPPALKEENHCLWQKLRQLEKLAEEKALVQQKQPVL